MESSVSHSGGGEHKVHYPSANRIHGTDYRMAQSTGYNAVPNKVCKIDLKILFVFCIVICIHNFATQEHRFPFRCSY